MSSDNSLEKAAMRAGDFRLRRADRQMFGNLVTLSSAGGTTALAKIRRSATFVETPVYDVPKLWRLAVEFETLLSVPVHPLSPWLPPMSTTTARVTVRRALDRDKGVAIETFDLLPLTNGPNTQSALPTELFEGHQVGVTVEILPGGSSGPINVQVSLVETTTEDRDPPRNSTIVTFVQSVASQNFLAPNKRRRKFIVQNWGTSPLYVAYDFFAVVPGIGARFSVALPNQGDIHEGYRDDWQGYVSGVWTADDADGIAAVTELY